MTEQNPFYDLPEQEEQNPFYDLDPPPTRMTRAAEAFGRLKTLGPVGLAKAIGETAMTGVTGFTQMTLGGLGELQRGVVEPPASESVAAEEYETGRPSYRFGGLQTGETLDSATQEIYQPQTQGGQDLNELIALPAEWWEEKAYDWAWGAGGSTEAERAGRVPGAAAAYTGLMMLPAVVGMPFRRARQAAKEKAAQPKPSQTLKQEANVLYERADGMQAGVTSKSFWKAIADIEHRLVDSGFTPALHPDTWAALSELKRRAKNNSGQTLRGVEIMRQVINEARGAVKEKDAFMAGRMMDIFDDWMLGLKDSDMVMGSPGVAKLYRDARQLWHRKIKADELEWAIERARLRAGANYTTAGFETAVRQEFKSILLNKRRRRMFNAEEIKAIEAVVEGDFSTNLLRRIGKFAVRGPVTGIAAGGAFAIEPNLGLALAGVGELGKYSSGVRTARKADEALETAAGMRPPTTR